MARVPAGFGDALAQRPRRRGSWVGACIHALLGKPWIFRLALSAYPPYLGTGLWVREVSGDFRSLEVRLRHHFYNQNGQRCHFGGSLFAMTDPFHALMLAQILGPRFDIWDQSAAIEFVAPGRGTVRCRFEIDDDDVRAITERTRRGEKALLRKRVDVVDEAGSLVARVDKVVYVRARTRERGTTLGPAAVPRRSNRPIEATGGIGTVASAEATLARRVHDGSEQERMHI